MDFIPSVHSAIEFVLNLVTTSLPKQSAIQVCRIVFRIHVLFCLFALIVVHQDIIASLSLLDAALGCDFDGNINVYDNWEGWTSAFSKVFFLLCPRVCFPHTSLSQIVDNFLRLPQAMQVAD